MFWVRIGLMRILVIEDEKKIAKAIKRGLSQESFAVDICFDSEEGLSMALTEPYDVMIIDRMLPGGHEGLEICTALRKRGIKTPILILTARDKIEERVRGLNAGADDYLVKPFAFEELLARIKALLRRPSDSLSKEITIEDLSLNATEFTAQRAGKKLDLSAKEFAILEYLMRNPKQILTRDNIISHVWDYDADILPNTLEVYIGYLRNKVDKPFKGQPALIHTVRGFGYKIGAY